MKDLTKYYIDLSKLSEVEVREVEKRTTKKCYYIKRAPFLHLFGKHWNQCMSESHSIKHKQELSYPEFIKLFEGGEVPDNAAVIQTLEAEKAELLEALEKKKEYLEEIGMLVPSEEWTEQFRDRWNLNLHEIESLIQRHKP